MDSREPIRAFISYSSKQAALARTIAEEVGRPFVHMDRILLDTGDDIAETLEKGIAGSSVFVLLASREALNSPWVKHEEWEAKIQRIVGRLRKVLVFLLDDTLGVQDLPVWLRQTQVTHSRGPKPLARAIRHTLDELVYERQHAFFVGRSQEIAELQRALVPLDGAPPPRSVAVSGLTGIGRKTLIRRVARDLLQLDKLVRIDVETGDLLPDLAAKFADQFEWIPSREIVDDILRSSEEECLKRIGSNLEQAASARELVMLYDEGGLLDSEGRISSAVRSILNAVPRVGLIALVSNRRPTPSGDAPGREVPAVLVRPLGKADITTLISLVAGSIGLALTPGQRSNLTELVAGFPPSVYFALEMMRHYGADAVFAASTKVVDFRVGPIQHYIRKAQLPGLGSKALKVLAGNSPLPLQVIARALGASEADIGKDLITLIDAALIEPDGTGLYRVSDPIVVAVEREYGPALSEHYAAVVDATEQYLRDVEDRGYLTLSRVMFRAMLLSGQGARAEQALRLSADYIQVAERLYHDRDYENAVAVAEAALEARPSEPDPRIVLIRALTKLQRFDEAAEQIATLERQMHRKEAKFLRGFRERHRGAWGDAIGHYRAALEAGYRGVAIHRELAKCYVEEGNLAEARAHIDQAKDPGNPYILDLTIQIACLQGDEDRARGLLEALATVDDPAFACHRRSRVEAIFGDPDAALQYARQAVERETGRRPPFEAMANLILCEIRTDRFDDAVEDLHRLDRTYPKFRVDIQIGLECRLAISQDRCRDALALSDRLEAKDRPVHLKLRRDAIACLLEQTAVDPAEYASLNAELRRLEERLSRLTAAQLEFFA